ncbi:MAG TPA: ATP-binding protein [Xanthomonadaceae bacterium]|nr:ATP-binding protein [Xanthomonadaceae bacterium]
MNSTPAAPFGDALLIELPADAGALARTLDRQEHLLRQAGIDEEACQRARLVSEEILSNALRHAAASRVSVDMAVDVRGLRLSFCDDAEPFDPGRAATTDPDTPLAGRSTGGLGLLLVQHLASALEYRRENGCNRLDVLLAAVPGRDRDDTSS